MTEVWKLIEGSTSYEVSNLGHIRKKMSFNRYRAHRPYKNKKGYYLCHIVKDGKSKTLSVANLVASEFVSNDCDGWIVRHKNGNVSDNNYKNLYWVNPKKRIGW